ncbi:MAG: cyanophycinase [Pirellulaceae bacterium]
MTSRLQPFRLGATSHACVGVLLALAALPAHAEESATPSGVTWIDPAGIRGSLVIVGGGELPAAVREKFFELAGGKEARIVVIPTAREGEGFGKGEAIREGEAPAEPIGSAGASPSHLLEPWKSAGAADVQVLHTRSKETANAKAFVAPLKAATAVWLGGGDQSRLADAYLGTAVEREILALLARGGVVGGTSAGAAIQSKTMIAGGQSEPKMATGLDLLPGAIIDQHFTRRQRQARLRLALARHPGHVGFGVDEGTALIVQGRRLQVLGDSAVSVFLAASASRPVREFELRPGEDHDLTMLRRAAIDRTLAQFPPQELPPARLAHGSLVIVGGGGMPREATERFIELAGGPDAPIVVLPTAIGEVIPDGANDARLFERAGARNVRVLKHRTRAEVESAEFAAALAEAKGVWFGGGRQWRFVDAYGGTRAEALLHDVLRRGGVIGGSSAGATIQGQYLVRGSALGNTEMMAEGYERGLAFLPGTAIDQHFSQRRRQADMTAVMHRFGQLLGIGIDERTALIVRGQTAEVVGAGQAHFYDYRAGPPTETPDYTAVPAGKQYDLVERK